KGKRPGCCSDLFGATTSPLHDSSLIAVSLDRGEGIPATPPRIRSRPIEEQRSALDDHGQAQLQPLCGNETAGCQLPPQPPPTLALIKVQVATPLVATIGRAAAKGQG